MINEHTDTNTVYLYLYKPLSDTFFNSCPGQLWVVFISGQSFDALTTQHNLVPRRGNYSDYIDDYNLHNEETRRMMSGGAWGARCRYTLRINLILKEK